MASVVIKVSGLRELGEAMRGLSNDIATKVLKSAATAGANKIRDEAAKIAKAKGIIRTGDMIKAIGVKRDKRGSRPGFEMRGIGVWSLRGSPKKRGSAKWQGAASGPQTPDYYWKFQELGTVNQGAKPYLRPALQAAHDAAVDAIKARIKKRIDAVRPK